ncbi:MAG: HEAT repeat domain-containing protein [Ignavibacteriales bacterium]|nr:HEAT repeat domain-containing protein [Ignavibacteriales bacterium]
MNREKFIEQVYLYLLDELQDKERIELENAMMEENQLREEFEKIKNEFTLIAKSKPSEADERLLINSRQSLLRKIRQSSNETSFMPDLIERVRFYFYRNHSLVLGGAVTLIASIGIAYMMFLKTAQYPSILNKQATVNTPQENTISETNNDKQMSNNFDSPSFEKRNINKSGLYESLIKALLEGSNDGIRIKSISAISNQVTSETFKPDLKIKNALIAALKKDKNPAVRREALLALQNYPFDDQIRDVMLNVLSKDKNSGIRVAAINALADWNHRQNIIDEVLKQELTKQSQVQKNSFVKIRAASILKEIE